MEDTWTSCVVALGSNMGDREQTLFEAVADIRATEGFRVIAESRVYDTVALTEQGPDPSQPGYLNKVVLIESAWSPERTLHALHSIEHAHGRVRPAERFADRTLDLDLITYGDASISSDDIVLPHPRAHERRFVLEPWLEIEPEAELPGKGLIRDLLQGLPPDAS